ncbi:MAG: DMT family transporter [Bacteroidota bacterium]
MIYLIISICCSVTVAVMLKLAKRYKINIPQAVTWNYLFAIALSFFFFKPGLDVISPLNATGIHIALGILLPLIFWFQAASVRNIGIVKTDIAQRLSLCIPLLAAYFLFKEDFTTVKLIGLGIGLLAIFLTLYKQTKSSVSTNWIYPALVFCGFGLIDTLFKQIAQFKAIPYTSSLVLIFVLSFVISLAFIAFQSVVRKKKLQMINFICGCILGFFNFFNILFYLKAHRAMADHPTTVFAAMNMGVIVVGTLVGVIIFKEKLSKLNYWGLGLALFAILLITLAQQYAI